MKTEENKSSISDILSFNVINWFQYPAFGNINVVEDSKGMIRPCFEDIHLVKRKCLNNCQLLSNPKGCQEYCDNLTKYYQTAFDFTRRICPDGDKECCKKAAPQNDYAFLYCMKEGQKRRKLNHHHHNEFYLSQHIQQHNIIHSTTIHYTLISFFICYIVIFLLSP